MLNGFEKETLLVLAQSAGAEKEEILKQLDERLSFRDNKRVLKRWLKDDGRSVDLRTELIKEKEMGVKAATESKKKMDEEEEKQYKIIEKQKTEITKYIQENKKNIMNEIVKYNPHCENITYTTLMSVMNAKDGNQKTNVINKGKQGIGKSRGTTELVRKLNISDAVIINGHITPKKLFETLRENMYATVILDESEATLSNPTSLFILRSALYGGKVQWLSSKGDLLDSYNFQGTLIANLNYLGINPKEAAPLYDRTLFNENNLNNSQIIEKIRSTQTYTMDKTIWKNIKNKLILIRKDGVNSLEETEKQKVINYITELVAKTSSFSSSLSTRAAAKANLVTRCMKTFYGTLDEDVWELTKKLIKPYEIANNGEDLIVQILKENPTYTRQEITELIAEKKEISVRQASRHIKSAIDKNILIAKNRTTLALPEVKV